MRFENQNTIEDKAGHYLVGAIGAWHGGIHLTGIIKVLADGEVVAYRISSDYKQAIDTNGEIKYYSDCFVLVRHKFEYNIEEDGEKKSKEFVFYSLYYHLQTKDEMLSGQGCPDFFHCCQKIKSRERITTKLAIKKGINLRRKATIPYGKENIQEIIGIIPKGSDILVYPEIFKINYYKATTSRLLKKTETRDSFCIEIIDALTSGYYYNKNLALKYEIREGNPHCFNAPGQEFLRSNDLYFYEKDKSAYNTTFQVCFKSLSINNESDEDEVEEIEGAILRRENTHSSDIIGILPNNDGNLRVRILEKGGGKWFKVRAPYIYVLKEDTGIKTVYEKQSSTDGYIGWCENINGQFDCYTEPEYDKVVILEKTLQVSAGDIIGCSGKYESDRGRLLTNYEIVHLEVFSNDDVPGFLADMKKKVTDVNKIYEFVVKKEEFKAESYSYLNSVEYNLAAGKTSCGKRKKPTELKLSDEGKSFIKAWEGCKLKGYRDIKNLLTIGYGDLLLDKDTKATIKLDSDSDINASVTIARVDEKYITTDAKGNKTIEITQDRANQKFEKHVLSFEEAVRKLNVDFYQWEFDAMVSLFFNTGSNVEAPSLRKHLNAGNYTDAGKQFNDITSGDKEGLVYRRAADMDMFLNGGEEGYVYFKNNDENRRDKLVDKLNAIREGLGKARYETEKEKMEKLKTKKLKK